MNQDLERRYLVVGVNDSAASYAALQWAAREAKLRETSLLVVRAWEDQAKIGIRVRSYRVHVPLISEIG